MNQGLDVFKEGDDVLLVSSRGKRRIVKIQGERIHTHKGYLVTSDIIGKNPGIIVRTHVGEEMLALRPSIADYIPKLTRRTQVIYPKDIGYVVLSLGVSSGSMVLEAGTGSGAATMVIASLVKPNGRVFSCDINEESIEIARRNLERVGLTNYVELIHGDIKSIDFKVLFDAAIIDIPDPWNTLRKIVGFLKTSARICIVVPTMNQLEKVYRAMLEANIAHLETVEIMLRRIRPFEGRVRPESIMIGHTAYLMIGAKIIRENI
ncbi:MAG: tRNA (adenine-N1)-methyltransferase [Crenarchaeota archaeon]|nr:tRNA (adenine-N1)-methyltransferase [Thermoproteota archaeon]MDW8034103.1 tRNA (adenine-N1)-methyltransferase [Nitrososphaerota archaeon]